MFIDFLNVTNSYRLIATANFQLISIDNKFHIQCVAILLNPFNFIRVDIFSTRIMFIRERQCRKSKIEK